METAVRMATRGVLFFIYMCALGVVPVLWLALGERAHLARWALALRGRFGG